MSKFTVQYTIEAHDINEASQFAYMLLSVADVDVEKVHIDPVGGTGYAFGEKRLIEDRLIEDWLIDLKLTNEPLF